MIYSGCSFVRARFDTRRSGVRGGAATDLGRTEFRRDPIAEAMQPKEATNGVRNGTHPLDPAAVREQLERILASQSFRNSKRHSAFLRYVVEETLNGNAGQLKERSVGVQVFGLDAAYDTSANPVVRVSAGELRKRVAQYYHEPLRESEVRIDLPPGSYVPEFRTADAPAQVAAPAPEPPARSTGLKPVWLLAAVGALAVAALVFWLKPWVSGDVFTEFWEPVWSSSGRAVITVAARPVADESGRPASERLALNDAIALANLTPVLKMHGKDFQVLTEGASTLGELKQGPAVLIGAFSNELSMRLMREARFAFDLDPDTKQPWVRDRQNPTAKQWQLDRNRVPNTSYTDYAMVSRLLDPTTDQIAVVAAGITARGTRAAGEFLSSQRLMQAVPVATAKSWPGRNVQIVLAVDVAAGKAGTPKVLATYSW
jgi:hypothetical protein